MQWMRGSTYIIQNEKRMMYCIFVSERPANFLCTEHLTWFFHIHKQLLGCTTPRVFPIALVQNDWASWLEQVKLTFWSLIPVQGFLELQSNFIAIGVADVPPMLRYITSLIRTPDTCQIEPTHKTSTSFMFSFIFYTTTRWSINLCS